MEQGGKGLITDQLLKTHPDVTLGGGANSFAEVAKAGAYKGKILNEQAQALAFAREEGNTLVVVTADHAHSSQIVENGTKVPGLTQALTTKDGAIVTISYGNSAEDSQEHTGSQLRIASYGPQAANVVGLTDQTDLFFTLGNAIGLTLPRQ